VTGAKVILSGGVRVDLDRIKQGKVKSNEIDWNSVKPDKAEQGDVENVK
jgi:hypothetical protein